MENVGLMVALAGAMTKAPTAEQVSTAVDAWLDDHPEATTTVTDGAITNAKLASSFVTPGTAAAYSSSATYAVGDYVFHGGTLYRCITAITTAEAWTAAHWTAAVLGDDVGDLKSALGSVGPYIMSNDALTDAHDAKAGTVYYLNATRIANCANLPTNADPGFLVSFGFGKELPYNYMLIYLPYSGSLASKVYIKTRINSTTWNNWAQVDASVNSSTLQSYTIYGMRIATVSEVEQITDANSLNAGIVYTVGDCTWANIPNGSANHPLVFICYGGYRNSVLAQMCFDINSQKIFTRFKNAQNTWDEWAEIGGASVNVVQSTGSSTTDVMSQNAVTSALASIASPTIRCSINLLKDTDVLPNTQLNTSDGSTSYHPSYKTSDFIPCDGNTAYRYAPFDSNGNVTSGFIGKFCYYDEDKTFISGHSNTGAQVVFITPATAKYFRVQAFDTGVSWMIVKGDFYKAAPGASGSQQRNIESPEYIPYNNMIVANGGRATNPLCGKYLIDFGDSIERGDGTNGKGIGYFAAFENQMAFTQYSVGGMTVADANVYYPTYDRTYLAGKNYYDSSNNLLTPGTDYTVGERITTSGIKQKNVLGAYIDSAIAAAINPDYIIVEGGTNDISSNVTLGDTISGYTGPFDTTEYAGALEDAFRRIRTKWPSAKVLYVRAHNMSSRTAEQQVTYGEMALKVCKKWSIKVVDMYTYGGLNTNIEIMRTSFTSSSDGTHPNEEGYRYFYANQVIEALKSL